MGRVNTLLLLLDLIELLFRTALTRDSIFTLLVRVGVGQAERLMPAHMRTRMLTVYVRLLFFLLDFLDRVYFFNLILLSLLLKVRGDLFGRDDFLDILVLRHRDQIVSVH